MAALTCPVCMRSSMLAVGKTKRESLVLHIADHHRHLMRRGGGGIRCICGRVGSLREMVIHIVQIMDGDDRRGGDDLAVHFSREIVRRAGRGDDW